MVEYIERLIRPLPKPVVLVGHSVAGVVITQVAENMPDKINQLVYVSGFIPQHGGSLMDEERKASVPTVALEASIDEVEGTISLNLPRARDLFYGKCSDEEVAYALCFLQKQPLRPFVDTVSFSSRFETVPKLYIECLQDQAIRLENQRRMHSQVACEVASLDTDHSPFFSADRLLVDILVK